MYSLQNWLFSGTQLQFSRDLIRNTVHTSNGVPGDINEHFEYSYDKRLLQMSTSRLTFNYDFHAVRSTQLSLKRVCTQFNSLLLWEFLNDLELTLLSWDASRSSNSIFLCFLFSVLDTSTVSTRRRFNVDITLFGRQQRCYNAETTLCVLGGYSC